MCLWQGAGRVLVYACMCAVRTLQRKPAMSKSNESPSLAPPPFLHHLQDVVLYRPTKLYYSIAPHLLKRWKSMACRLRSAAASDTAFSMLPPPAAGL